MIAYPQLQKFRYRFSNNIPAIKAYEKCGFKIAATFKSDTDDILHIPAAYAKYVWRYIYKDGKSSPNRKDQNA